MAEPRARKQDFECVLIVQKPWLHRLKSRWKARQEHRRSLGFSELAVGGFRVLTDCNEMITGSLVIVEIKNKYFMPSPNAILDSPTIVQVNDDFEYDTEFWETEEEIEQMSSKNIVNIKDCNNQKVNLQFLQVDDDDCWMTEEEIEVVELSSTCLRNFTTNKINYA
ncbi:12874_t:CDS:2 [Ambispora leptoticha]|uniref:12874_t:CDS:1 n=1 Tax=Ambispora leptoticha TaxID=144679 RepID=A0A9N8WM51_9GLOM|nr:12874_t:CDS:2 [Ambispora leptoticha]